MEDLLHEAQTWPQHHFSQDEQHHLIWWTTQNWCFLLHCTHSMYGKLIQASLRVQTQSNFNWRAAWRPQFWRIPGDDPSSSGARLQMRSSEASQCVRTWHRCCDVLSHRRCETWLQTARPRKSELCSCSTGNYRRVVSHCLISSQPRGKRYANPHTLSSLTVLLHTVLYKK